MDRLLTIVVFLVMLISCKNSGVEEVMHPMDRLADDKAGEVVRKAIAYVGGWDTWAAKKNFSFYKKITQVDSVGNIKRIVKQLHEYNLKDQFKARMTWAMDSTEYMIINDGGQAKKYEKGKEMTDDKSKNEAWNSSFGSHYVVAMPYKLTDPGTKLTYVGIDSTTFSKPAHAIKVEYAKGAGSSGGMHVWCYYFDEATYDMVGNYLDYGKGHSFTTYETSEMVDGLKIHNKRYSHASNENKEILELKTIYENEAMKFDSDLDANLFVLQ